jgi:hypothetical protein
MKAALANRLVKQDTCRNRNIQALNLAEHGDCNGEIAFVACQSAHSLTFRSENDRNR